MLRTEALLNNSFMSDIKVRCELTGNEWYAHKLILASHSHMLKAKFISNMSDSKGEIISLKYGKDTILQLLTYIYTGQLNIEAGALYNYELILELYNASQYLIIPKLTEKIEKILPNIIDDSTFTFFMKYGMCHDIIRNGVIHQIRCNFLDMEDNKLLLIWKDLLVECLEKGIDRGYGKKLQDGSFFRTEYNTFMKIKRWCKLHNIDKHIEDSLLVKYVCFEFLSKEECLQINGKKYSKLKSILQNK